MAANVSSYIATTGTSASRNADQISFSFLARPQSLTAYVRFVELGSMLASSAMRILHIGLLATTNPRFDIYFSGTNHALAIVTASTSRTSVLAGSLPALGDVVELRGTIASNGAIQLHRAINGGSEESATATAALVLPTAWAGTNLILNNEITTRIGTVGVLNVLLLRGVQTLETMRQVIGIS